MLQTYLEARAVFSAGDFAVIREAFLIRRLCAGEFLQRAGDVTQYAAFVASGCLRNYVIDARGKEHILQFAPETWWLADGNSLHGRTPSPYFIDAIEDSQILLIDGPSHQALVERIGGYAAAFRVGLQRHAAAKDERIVRTLTTSAAERYRDFLRVYPTIAPRVPQSMIASYLGMCPETVSRIRKKWSRALEGTRRLQAP